MHLALLTDILKYLAGSGDYLGDCGEPVPPPSISDSRYTLSNSMEYDW